MSYSIYSLLYVLSFMVPGFSGYTEKSYFSDKIVFNSRIEIHYGCCLTLEKCQKLCSVHAKCGSFFYNDVIIRCQLHYDIFTVDNMGNLTLKNETGWRYYIEQCEKYLIIESAVDADSLISTSGAHQHCTTKDRYKINSTEGNLNNGEAGGWCSSTNLNTSFVQVTFDKEHRVLGVATQGREPYTQYVTQYQVLYSTDCITFHTDGKIYPGNTDATSVVINMFDVPIIGKCFRINPNGYINYMSMRFDFIGCSI